MTYNYTNLSAKIKSLSGLDRNKLEYVEYAIELLTEEYMAIAKYFGRLDGEKSLCQTITSRKSRGYSDEDVINIYEQGKEAEYALKLIDEVIRLTKKKIEYLID